MILSVLHMIQHIPKVSVVSHRVSRFSPLICDIEVPKRFQTPNMKMYDGTTDLKEHVTRYRESMEIVLAPQHLKEGCLCKGLTQPLQDLYLSGS